MITLFGIKNCDSVKKARKWLDAENIAYTFVDFRTDGIAAETIASWLTPDTIDLIINKRSTTWKGLDASEKSNIENWIQSVAQKDTAAIQLLANWLVDNPTLIKRPVAIRDTAINNSGLTIGFNNSEYQSLFSN